FPSSVWPTRLPAAATPSKQAGRPVVAATEAAASPGPERDSALTKDGEGAEEGEKDEKSESEDGEGEHEEEEEKDAEKKEKNRATVATEARNSTEPSVATASSPNRTAEEEGNKTISGEEPNQNVAPTAGGPEDESLPEADTQPQPLPSTQVPPVFTNELYPGKIPRRPETTRKPPPKEDRFPEEYPSDNKFITINPGE
ncbi:PTPRG phosphatase, partial [Zapornia atra]|nr:PTPRG phosphatase [Zapornia atra]